MSASASSSHGADDGEAACGWAESSELGHALAVAPMLEVSNVHFFTAMRMLTKRAALYSEMIHCNTIVYATREGRIDSVLGHDDSHRPLILQLGGSDPQQLAAATRIVVERYPGYREINLNCGCPSAKVSKGAFGACLMKQPERVVAALRGIRSQTDLPVTVKCRLGVDDLDSYAFIHSFVGTVAEQAGVDHFIIHARKAFLKGLDPKANRTVPPLRYDDVFRLVDDYPAVRFSLNGGVKTMAQARELLLRRSAAGRRLYGCMIGRTAYENCWEFADCDRAIFGVPNPPVTRRQLLLRYAVYADSVKQATKKHVSLAILTRPILSIMNGQPGATTFRSRLSSKDGLTRAGSYQQLIADIIAELDQLCPDVLDALPPS